MPPHIHASDFGSYDYCARAPADTAAAPAAAPYPSGR